MCHITKAPLAWEETRTVVRYPEAQAPLASQQACCGQTPISSSLASGLQRTFWAHVAMNERLSNSSTNTDPSRSKAFLNLTLKRWFDSFCLDNKDFFFPSRSDLTYYFCLSPCSETWTDTQAVMTGSKHTEAGDAGHLLFATSLQKSPKKCVFSFQS